METAVVTVSQASQATGVTGDTIRRLMRAGEILTAPADGLPKGHGRQPTMGVYVDDFEKIRLHNGNGNGNHVADNGHSALPPHEDPDAILDRIASLIKSLRKALKGREAEIRAEARREALATLGEELVRNAR